MNKTIEELQSKYLDFTNRTNKITSDFNSNLDRLLEEHKLVIKKECDDLKESFDDYIKSVCFDSNNNPILEGDTIIKDGVEYIVKFVDIEILYDNIVDAYIMLGDTRIYRKDFKNYTKKEVN